MLHRLKTARKSNRDNNSTKEQKPIMGLQRNQNKANIRRPANADPNYYVY